MISGESYRKNELETDYHSLCDYEELVDDDTESDPEMEFEFQPEQTDLQGLAELYYEYCGKRFPMQYKSYANKEFISETWGTLTCSVVNTLDEIGWMSMSSHDKRAYFEVIAAYAQNDKRYYIDNFHHIVYAILYQIVWATCKKFHNDAARLYIDDIISETLARVASNTSQLGKYDPTYSPITYLDRLAKTTASEVYYELTGTVKRKSSIRRDAEIMDKIVKQSDGYNEHIAHSVGFLQLFMEIKRSQNPPAYTEIANFLHSITNKTQSYEDNMSSTTDEDEQNTVLGTNEELDDDSEVVRGIKAALDVVVNYSCNNPT